jgi:hypothetical protein
LSVGSQKESIADIRHRTVGIVAILVRQIDQLFEIGKDGRKRRTWRVLFCGFIKAVSRSKYSDTDNGDGGNVFPKFVLIEPSISTKFLNTFWCNRVGNDFLGKRFLSPHHQFDALCKAAEDVSPSKVALMREFNATTQTALLDQFGVELS